MHELHLAGRSTIAATLCSLVLATGLFAQPGYRQTKPLDPDNMDTSVQPCSDFYRYVNGGWLGKNPVPAAYSNWGSFSEITERNNEILQGLLLDASAKRDAPKASSVQLVGDFYVSGMDSVRRDADGMNPLAEEFCARGGNQESCRPAKGDHTRPSKFRQLDIRNFSAAGFQEQR